MDYSNRTYATVLTSEIGSVDFGQVMQTSADTVRKSVNETQFVLKWYTAKLPSFISPSGSMIPTWSGSHAECLNLMTGSFWSDTGSMP